MTTFLSAFLPPFKRHLAHGAVYSCLFYEWSPDTRTIIANKTALRRFSIYLWTMVDISCLTFQILNMIFGSYTLTDNCIGLLIFILYSACFIYSLEWEPNLTPMEIINRLSSERGIGNNCISNFTINPFFPDVEPRLSPAFLFVVKMMYLAATPSYWILPLSAAGMTVVLPCKPPLFGSFLLCRIGPVRILLGAMEHGIATQIVMGGFHHSVFCKISGLVLLWGKCQNVIKSAKKDEERKLVKGYRELQVQEKIHNFIYKAKTLPVSVFATPLIQILSGFTFVVLLHNANLFQLAIFLVIYLGSMMFSMIVLSSAASIYVKTEEWINDLKLGKNKYFRRVHKSFRPLRLEFDNNYVDRLTPLVIQEFCMTQTASLLLLTSPV